MNRIIAEDEAVFELGFSVTEGLTIRLPCVQPRLI